MNQTMAKERKTKKPNRQKRKKLLAKYLDYNIWIEMFLKNSLKN